MARFMYRIGINFIHSGCPYLLDMPDEKFLRWYLVKSIEYDEDKSYDVLTLVDSDGRFVKVTAVDVYEKRVKFVQSHEWNDMSELADRCIVIRRNAV